MLVDTHCHLNDDCFEGRLGEVLDRATRKGVLAVIVPAYDRPSLEKTARSMSSKGNIFLAFGMHPWYLDDELPLSRIESLCKAHHAVAIGEIGLDFVHQAVPRVLQEEQLRSQLELSVKLNLPVILHCRKAFDRMYQILSEWGGRIRGVMHSFSGSLEMAEQFIGLGLHIAFSGSVTRKSAKKYHRVAREIPLDRMLLETDAPCIATETTPAALVEPAHVEEVAHSLAELRNLSLEEIGRRTTENAVRLFSLEGVL